MKTDALKIGILTFHRCINYGSYWQAKCLADEIGRRGHRVSILDHRSGRIDFAEWRCALQPVLPTPVPSADHRLYRKKIGKFFQAFEQLPLSPSFSLDDASATEDYDQVIAGSDEVWNLSHPWYGTSTIFWGDGIRPEKLIAYAASFGNYDASTGIPEDYQAKLRRFRHISVRDENSRFIVRNAVGYEPRIVLDPCLQFPARTERHDTFIATEPFAAVYGHNFSESFIRNAREWSRQRKIPLVSIGYRNDWADEQWLTAGPFDFVSFIKQSETVITNFFHGCIFALVNSKPFVCEKSSYRNIKVTDLMNRIGGEVHLISEDTTDNHFRSLLNEPVSQQILRNINRLRMESSEYLDNSLKRDTSDELNEEILQSEEYH